MSTKLAALERTIAIWQQCCQYFSSNPYIIKIVNKKISTAENILTLLHKNVKASFRYRFSQGTDSSVKCVSEVIATDALVLLQSVQTAEIKSVCQPTPVANLPPYPLLGAVLSHDDMEFESCQLCGHEKGLLQELVHPAATVLCQSTAVCRMLTNIG